MADNADVPSGAGDEQDETVPEVVVETRYGVPVTDSNGQAVLHPDREHYLEVVAEMRRDGYWVCVDLCGVDYLGHSGDRGLPAGVGAERFEVVSNYLDPTGRSRLRVRLQVPESDPTAPTVFRMHPSAEYHERETSDLFGISFEGHPDPSRILMPEDWDGHPLRKDYAVGRIPVQFKGTRSAR